MQHWFLDGGTGQCGYPWTMADGRLADKFGRLLVLRVQVFVAFSAVSRCLARRRWPQRYSSRCRWLYAISGGDGMGLRES